MSTRVAASEPPGVGVPESANRNGAFPRLDAEQRARLRAIGRVRTVQPGDILFKDGDAGYDLFVIESGAVAIVEGYRCEDSRVIALQGRHRFLGELSLLTGATVTLTAVVRDAGEVIQVPVEKLLELLKEDQELANIVMRAYIARREILIKAQAGVRVIGSRYSADVRRLREFLARNRVPYHWLDLEQDAEAEQLLRALSIPPGQTPVVLGAGGVLRNPSNAEVAAMLGLGARGEPPQMCDLVIVGGGPAGLAAAVYGASEGLDTQAIDAVAFGGQASTSSRIENYLGFPNGVSGSELAERAMMQARKFGARLVVPAQASAIARDDGHYAIRLADGGVVNGRTVIVATGAQYRRPDVPDLERWEGESVYYAATVAEAQMCAGSPVLVVGGGNSAGQAAMFLSEYTPSCRLLIRGGDLGRSMSRYLIDEIEQRGRIEVMTYSEIVELSGNGTLETALVANTRTGERRLLPAKAVFMFIGASPHTDWLRGQVAMDEDCFVLTGADVGEEDLAEWGEERPYFLETSMPGVFAVGDVHSGSVKRCASAVGEGSMAVRLAYQRLEAR